LNSVLTQTHSVTARSDRRRARTALVFAAIGALWFLLCRELSGEWSLNEQYNYGWFVPFFALYLFWLRWQNRPEPSPPRKTLLVWIFIGVPALLLLLPLRLFESEIRIGVRSAGSTRPPSQR
jgi:drug/metabolite transporter (DMT)-like permease